MRGRYRIDGKGYGRWLMVSLLTFGLLFGSLVPARPAAALSLFGDESPLIRQQTDDAQKLQPEIGQNETSSSEQQGITPSSASEMQSEDAVLTWKYESTPAVTFDIRVSKTDLRDDTGQLTNAAQQQDGLSELRYVLGSVEETTYYWQVRPCENGICADWSTVWQVTIDNTAPTELTVRLDSEPTETTVRLAGSTEPYAEVSIRIDDTTCRTLADSEGAWNCEFDDQFTYGSYSAVATATDAAGNTSTLTELAFTLHEQFIAEQITEELLPETLEIGVIEQTLDKDVVTREVPERMSVHTVKDSLEAKPQQQASSSVDILETSEEGWKVLGVPWFYWLGGAGGMMGGWWTAAAALGARRYAFFGI